MQIAEKLPPSLKYVLKYAYGTIPPHIRYGKTFRDPYRFLQESQWWSRDQLEEYQLDQLKQLLHHAYENVPYYRRLFDERGLKPKDFQDFKDLRKLPYLTKEIIQNNVEDLKARNIPSHKFQYVTTSGSTGIPLGFYYETGVTTAKELAFIHTLWNRVGYRPGDKCVVLRGNVVPSADEGKYWEYNPLDKNLIMSSYHLTDTTIPLYIAKIRQFRPDYFQAYPSVITILARYMKEHNIPPFPSVRAILCGSENLYPAQRALLEDIFFCRVYSWYGHSERAVLAGECEKSTCYHVFPEYGFVELVGSDDKPVTNENSMGEVIVTGFLNHVFPFIRYRTMDLAWTLNATCQCGRNYPLLKKVEGRLQELIITKTGRLISMTAINMHSDVFDNVKQFQFFQEKKGEVIFNIIKKDTYTSRDTRYIENELQKKLGADVDLHTCFVDHIPRTQSGKYRWLIQKLPIEFGE